MAGQQLMPALVGQNRFEGKIFRGGIAFKRLGVNGQQVLFSRPASSVLSAACLTVNVPIFDTSDKTKPPSKPIHTGLAGTPL